LPVQKPTDEAITRGRRLRVCLHNASRRYAFQETQMKGAYLSPNTKDPINVPRVPEIRILGICMVLRTFGIFDIARSLSLRSLGIGILLPSFSAGLSCGMMCRLAFVGLLSCSLGVAFYEFVIGCFACLYLLCFCVWVSNSKPRSST
jgi:hypothetical protein